MARATEVVSQPALSATAWSKSKAVTEGCDLRLFNGIGFSRGDAYIKAMIPSFANDLGRFREAKAIRHALG